MKMIKLALGLSERGKTIAGGSIVASGMGTMSGALTGATINGLRQAYKNQKLKPEERKSINEAIGKGALAGGATGGYIGALGGAYLGKKFHDSMDE